MIKKESKTKSNKKFYLVSVDMGYGHQRAAYPFLDLAEGGVITANNYLGASEEEKKFGKKTELIMKQFQNLKPFPWLAMRFFL